jgi:UDP-N-acetylmuramate dehydrogenase
MSKHTTVKIGGPADIWFEPKTNTELISAVKFAKEIGIPVTVIGGGSNILVGEKAYVAWLLGTIVRV